MASRGWPRTPTERCCFRRRGHVERFVDGAVETLYRFPPAMWQLQFIETCSRIVTAACGSAASSGGLMHIHQGVIDVFGEIDGLSSDVVTRCSKIAKAVSGSPHREGLHRFRDVAVVSVSTRQGLSSPRANALLAHPDGSVWISTFDGLNRMTDDDVTVYRERPGTPADRLAHHARPLCHRAGLPPSGVQCIFRDSLGRIWFSTESGVGYLEHDRLVTVNGVPRSD